MADGDGGNTLYQHLLIFGRPGYFIVRVDDDPETERVFDHYDSALLYLVHILGAARYDMGVKLHE